jgi:hypothetical protein
MRTIIPIAFVIERILATRLISLQVDNPLVRRLIFPAIWIAIMPIEAIAIHMENNTIARSSFGALLLA